MKKLTKRLLTLFIAAIMICSLPLAALATGTENTSGISVLLGDKLLTFADVSPEAHDGHIFVPVRAIFESLGAQVSYDGTTSTATAVKGDTTVKLALGEKTITVTEGGSTQTIGMDVASYVLNNRLMVPVRFAAQVFGCKVGWDAATQTAIILDVNGLLSSNSAEYTLMDKYLAYSNKFSQSYALAGTFKMSVEINDEGTTIPVVSNGTIDAIYDSSAVNLELGMTLDMTEMVAALGEEDDTQTALILNMLKDINIEYIFNIDEGIIYLRSSLLSLAIGGDADTWFSVDLNKLLAESGSSYAEMMTGNQVATSFTDAIESICGMVELNDVETAKTLAEMLTLVNTTFGDAAFTKSSDTYTTALNFDEDDVTVSCSLALTVKADVVTGFNWTMKAAAEEVTMDMTCSMDANDKMNMTMNMNMPDMLKFSFDMALQYTKTTKAAATSPEAGSTIVPIDESGVLPTL